MTYKQAIASISRRQMQGQPAVRPTSTGGTGVGVVMFAAFVGGAVAYSKLYKRGA